MSCIDRFFIGLSRLLQRRINARALRSGETWFLVQNEEELWYSTCHTTGSVIWVKDSKAAERIHINDVKQLLPLYPGLVVWTPAEYERYRKEVLPL